MSRPTPPQLDVGALLTAPAFKIKTVGKESIMDNERHALNIETNTTIRRALVVDDRTVGFLPKGEIPSRRLEWLCNLKGIELAPPTNF